MLKPRARFDKVTDITPEFLNENNIKGIILDVDNTLLDLDEKPIQGLDEWIKSIKEAGIKIVIASNSYKKQKLEYVSKKVGTQYIRLSLKPFKRGLKKAKKILELKSNNIAEIGDQLFTDVYGANRMKMFSILTTPISEEKHAISKLKRKIERKFL